MLLPATVCVGAPAHFCIGFIDGTFRPCARPVVGQQLIYSGYYKSHGFKFQNVVAPNGLIVDFYGPVPGRRGDGFLLKESQFKERMRSFCHLAGGNYYVYGDPAYPMCPWIMRGFKGAMTPRQAKFTSNMNSLRISVEWSFSLIVRDWSFMDHEKNLKVWKQPIAKMYYVSAIMANVKTCMIADEHDGRGNLISTKFDLEPPTLHDYLHA